MIRINLLPPDSIKKEERQEYLLIAYAILFILLIAGFCNFGIKYKAYKQVEGKVKNLEQELSKYEAIVKQVESLQTTKTILENQRNVINTLMTFRLIYPHFFEDLIRIIPDNIWFKSMDTKLDTNGNINVNLNAESMDTYSISDFITSLAANDNFQKVELGPITTSGNEKFSTSAFRITFYHRKAAKK